MVSSSLEPVPLPVARVLPPEEEEFMTWMPLSGCELTPECDERSLAAGLARCVAADGAADPAFRFSLEAKQPESRGKERRLKTASEVDPAEEVEACPEAVGEEEMKAWPSRESCSSSSSRTLPEISGSDSSPELRAARRNVVYKNN